jgi:DNA-binding transcriptional LysR family regulator
MDPNRKLLDLWNRLPVFKVVAETEHLPTASQRLHITAPAISRTIKLLEEDLGQPVFRRVGRNLALNAAGKQLLQSLGGALSALEHTLMEMESDPLSGPVRIATIGVLTDFFVLPAILALKDEHPDMQPGLLLHGTLQANDLLARGQLDVAFYYQAATDERLNIDLIGQTTAGVYCGSDHPLFARKEVRSEDILAHPFSVPQSGVTGQVMDGWPVDVPRQVGLRITMLYTNLHVCLSGKYLTVLPDVLARSEVAAGRLRRLPFAGIEPITVYAARRRSDGPRTVADTVIEAVRARLAWFRDQEPA